MVMRPARGLQALAAATLAAVLLSPAGHTAAGAATPPPQASAHEVEAAFLYHFAHLVDWPEAATTTEPLVVAVVGRDPFGPALDQLKGKAVRARPIEVRRFATPAELDPRLVHVLFVGGDADAVERTLAVLGGAPVLTVGEVERFAERGGMIGFRVTPEGRVGFDINLKRAERAGLRLRSQLLKLARIVGDTR
jgi:uncharacterized protein DUF4154